MIEDNFNPEERETQPNENLTPSEGTGMRVRRRIPHGEKVGANRDSMGMDNPYENRYASESPYERRSYSRPSYGESRYQQRPDSYGRPSYDSRYGYRRHSEDDIVQYTPRERAAYENSQRAERPYAPSYERRPVNRYSEYVPQNRQPYSNDDDFVPAYRRENDMYERRDNEPRVAYARGAFQGNNRRFGAPKGTYAVNNNPRKPQPKKKKAKQNGPEMISVPKEVVRYKEMNVDPTQPVRLNKFIANSGVCSRRDADMFIQAGYVKVNGEVVKELGVKVMRSDIIKFKDRTLVMEDKVYVLLNKPKDYVTTSDDPQNRKKVLDLVRNACPERIFPVGRLDRNTTGVLLLTNDGELASQLTHPKFLKKKVYHVFLNKEIEEEQMAQIRQGLELEDGEVHADAIEYAKEGDKKQVGIEIHSGKNRIVRRIFEHLGFHVTKLDRVYFAGLTKKNLKRGQWRYLTAEEVSMLKMGAFE